jgi:hypothetical protein
MVRSKGFECLPLVLYINTDSHIARCGGTTTWLFMLCAFHVSLAESLRKIPAAQSERQALFGLDPTQLAMVRGGSLVSGTTKGM